MPQTNTLHAATKNNNKKTGLGNVVFFATGRQKNDLKNVNLLTVSALGNTVGLCDLIGFL